MTESEKNKVKKILVIQIKQLGDCILTEPVFRALKKKWNDSRTSFLVSSSFSSLFENNPYIDEIIGYNFKKPFSAVASIRRRKFDVVFDFLGNPRSRILTLLSGAFIKAGFKKKLSGFFYNVNAERAPSDEYAVDTKFRLLSSCGIEDEPGIAKIYLTDEEKKLFSRFSDYIAISPVSRRPARRWRKDYFARLADSLIGNCGKKVVFLWGPGEREYMDEIISMMKGKALLAPPTTPREIALLLRRCRLLVTNCNGMKHIAVACGTPTITIHGPTHWKSWHPPDERHKVIYADVPCLFCGRRKCDDMRCMRELKPETVEKKIVEMLK